MNSQWRMEPWGQIASKEWRHVATPPHPLNPPTCIDCCKVGRRGQLGKGLTATASQVQEKRKKMSDMADLREVNP